MKQEKLMVYKISFTRETFRQIPKGKCYVKISLVKTKKYLFLLFPS